MACAAPAQTIDVRDYFGLGHNHFFLFIVVTTFIITLVWTFFYLLQVKDTIKVRSIKVEVQKVDHRYAGETAVHLHEAGGDLHLAGDGVLHRRLDRGPVWVWLVHHEPQDKQHHL